MPAWESEAWIHLKSHCTRTGYAPVLDTWWVLEGTYRVWPRKIFKKTISVLHLGAYGYFLGMYQVIKKKIEAHIFYLFYEKK